RSSGTTSAQPSPGSAAWSCKAAAPAANASAARLIHPSNARRRNRLTYTCAAAIRTKRPMEHPYRELATRIYLAFRYPLAAFAVIMVVGTKVLRELIATGRPSVVIEPAAAALEAMREVYPRQHYLHGDGADDELLRGAGVQRAAGVFAVTGDDNKNLVVTLSAKQLNP